MIISKILVIIALMFALFLILALAAVFIYLGIKMLRSGFSKTKSTSATFTYQNSDQMPEEVRNIFNNIPGVFNHPQQPGAHSNQAPYTPDQNHGSQKTNVQTPPAYGQYDKTQNTSEQQPIPANPYDKLPGGNYNIKVLILVLVWMTAFAVSINAVSDPMDQYVIPFLRRNMGFSQSIISIACIVIYMAILSLFFISLFVICNKMQKNLPQFYARGTVAAKKIIRRLETVGRISKWRNYFCLTIALENNVCTDFYSPSTIYNVVLEGDAVNVVYNKLSDNEFLIVNLNRQF